MKKLILLIFVQLLYNLSFGLNIKIIESQSMNSGHAMDTKWSGVVTAMGHTPAIVPQTTLDNTAFFASTDILIISSGTIALPANRVATILQFLQTGKPVYLQSEYLSSYTTNQAFASIITSLGGSFTWNTHLTGDLHPMIVLGTYATTNNTVASLPYYWYSVSGAGDCNTINILSYGGLYHGFQYIPSNPAYGSIITTTDQDWINTNTLTDIALMKNFITHLISPPANGSGSLQVNIGNDTTLCQGNSLLLNASTNNATYLWQNASTNATFNVTQAGTYWVRVTANGCTATDTIHIGLSSAPFVNLGNDTTLCQGESILLNAASANSTYLWQNNSVNSTFNVTQAGTYWVKLTNSCGSKTDSINVNFTAPPQINLGNDSSICQNDSIILNATSFNSTYLWQDNSSNPTFKVTQSGTYRVTVTNNCGSVSDSINVIVLPLPTVNLGIDTSICQNDTIILNATTTNASYLWQDNSTNPTFKVMHAGTYWVTVTNSCGSKTDSINISIKQLPVIDLGNDTTICQGQVVSLDASNPNAFYLWQNNSSSPNFIVRDAGTYWVVINNNCGVISDTIIIEVKDCDCSLYIPNAFTPNGDDINNNFQIKSNCDLQKYNLIIYNRWGENIFETNNPYNSWDGTFSGKMCPIGVYVYILTYSFDNKIVYKKTGKLTLIR